MFGHLWAVRTHLAAAGIRRAFAPELTGELEVGASEVMFGDGTRQDGPAVIVKLHGPGLDPGPVRAELSVQRNYPSAAVVGVNRSFGPGQIAARWESLVDMEGGVFRNPNLTRRLVAGAQDTLLRANVLGLEASYARTRPFRLEGKNAEVFAASGWLVRRLRPWLSGRGEYSYLWQTSEGGSPASTFHRVRVGASLTLAL